VVDKVKLGILYAVFLGGVALYVVLYWGFWQDIVNADGVAPNLDNGAVQLASGIGGALAAVFAVAFGLQRKDATVNEKKLKLGATLTPNAQFVTTGCILVYFLVGVVTAYISLRNNVETPQEIKTPLTIFLGYLGAMFVAVVTGPGRTE
jgi:hypothetical protein